MDDELDERFLYEEAHFGIGCDHVYGAVYWEHGTELGQFQELADEALASKPGQALVPDGGEKLLHIRVSHKLRER